MPAGNLWINKDSSFLAWHYKVEATPQFLADAKKLSKKYSSLKNDLAELAKNLSVNPEEGTALERLFQNPFGYYIKRKGKSGGARVITCVIRIDKVVYLAAIYDKSEKDSVSDKELKELVKEVTKTKKVIKKIGPKTYFFLTQNSSSHFPFGFVTNNAS